MTMPFLSSGMHGLSLATFPSVKPSCPLHCHFPTVKASLSASARAKDNGFSLVSEESIPAGTKKKERLSRQERAAVVESFVLKYMEAHQGALPNVTTVLKNTGGARNVVKDILSGLESRYTQPISAQDFASNVSIEEEEKEESSSEIIDEEREEAGMYNHLGLHEEDEEEEEEKAGEIKIVGDEDAESEGEDEDAEDEFEECESSGVRGNENEDIERKTVTSSYDGTTGSSQVGSETHNRLSLRLRGMGISNSLQQLTRYDSSEVQGTSRRFRPSGMAGSYLPGQDFSESDSNKENGRVPGRQALGYSSAAENGPRNGTYSGGRMEDASGTSSDERHGIFVRYLSCRATPKDLREAFADCGDIVRAYAIRARPNVKYTYGFVDFKTAEALQKALAKTRVYIRGSRVTTEPSTTTPHHLSNKSWDDSQNSSAGGVESTTSQGTEKVTGTYVDAPNVKAIRGSGYKVAVMGIPMNVPLSEVQSALSKYGEIVLSDMKQENIGTYSANLEFKAVDSRDDALSAKSVQLNGSQYPIFRVNPVNTSVVRLSNVGVEANLDQIGATCELFGRVSEVVARCDFSVDVYFQSTELENMSRILARLNEVTMNGRRWHAQPSPCLGSGSYEALLKTREGQEWLQLESERMLSKVENALKELVVDVEDLQELVKVNRRYMELTKNSGD